MNKLFISHSSQDDAFVRNLRAALADHGQAGGIDSRDLRGGDPLWPEIQKAIEEASAYAVVVSPHALQSEWVGKELRHALAVRDQRGKDNFPVIPLSLNGTKLGVLEELFGEEAVYITASSDAGGVETAMNAILVAMGKRMPADVRATAQPKAEPLETKQSTNPFPPFAACLYTEEPILTLKLDQILSARAELHEYFSDLDNEATLSGKHIGVRGAHGSGKTHLLTDLAHELHSRRKDSTCLYARGDADSLEFYKQLMHQISRDRLFQLVDISASKKAGNVNIDRFETLRELVGKPLDPALEISFQSSDPAQAESAYRWLMGDPVQEFGKLDTYSQLTLLRIIATLHRSARVPLLVLIDELEGLLEMGNKEKDSFPFLKDMTEVFVSNGSCVVIAGLDEAWSAMPADAMDRFGKPEVHMAELSVTETKQLLELYASGNTRLSAKAVAAIHQQSGGNPRNILSIAHQLFEMFAGELQAATPQSVTQVAKERWPKLQDAESLARHSGVTERVSAHTDNPALVDELDRKPFAEVIGIRIEQVSLGHLDGNQEASAFMVNLHGPWGAGKTSVLNFLEEYLQSKERAPEDRWVVVEFNAWRHQRLQPPWWTLIKEIQAQAVHQLNFRDRIHVRIGWLWWRMRADWLPSIAAAVLMLVAVLLTTGVITLTKQAAGVPDPALGTPQSPVTPDSDQIAKAIELALKIITAVAAAGAAVLAISRSLVFGSGSAAKAYVDARSDPLRPIIKLFRRLVKAIGRPLIVLGDDLDRCDGPYVIALLEGIQTLFRSAPVTYVVAADRKWICSSFEQKYGGFDKAISEPGRSLGYLFLDKVFQVSASVPRLSQALQHTYWNSLLGAGTERPSDVKKAREEADKKAIAEVKNDRTSEELDAKIEATKATEDPIAQQAMRAAAAKQIISPEAMQVTEHRLKHFADLVEANPRSMKRLVNAYGLYQAAHFLEGRTVPPEILVRWTILELRWPLLAEHLASRPHTLRSFKAGESLGPGLSDEIQTLLSDDTVQAVLGVDVKSKTIKLDEQSVRQIIGTDPGAS